MIAIMTMSGSMTEIGTTMISGNITAIATIETMMMWIAMTRTGTVSDAGAIGMMMITITIHGPERSITTTTIIIDHIGSASPFSKYKLGMGVEKDALNDLFLFVDVRHVQRCIYQTS